MTYIEFFTKTAAENICGCLAKAPQRVVLVGDRMKLLQKHAQRYRRIFLDRGQDVEFICRSVNRNNMQNIIQALSELVETYGDCVFDLTGGEELYLVAVGIVCQRFRDRHLQLHRFNIHTGTIVDCDLDGTTIWQGQSAQMTVEENIRVYGGDVIYDRIRPGGTFLWDMDPEFREDIRAMWNVCSRDVRLWNAQIGLLELLEGIGTHPQALTTYADREALEDHLRRSGKRFLFSDKVLEGLRQQGLLTDCGFDEWGLTVSYKNAQVKRCLTKAGLALEMYIYLAALEARDEEGSLVYNDVCNGVCIDWDGQIREEAGAAETVNEIDVMMMHGVVPVFVSCKNGTVSIDELYKLHSVAESFGGEYAKKVLVATALDGAGSFDEYFRQRAKDMNIRLVEGIQEMTSEQLNRSVRSFWSN